MGEDLFSVQCNDLNENEYVAYWLTLVSNVKFEKNKESVDNGKVEWNIKIQNQQKYYKKIVALFFQ